MDPFVEPKRKGLRARVGRVAAVFARHPENVGSAIRHELADMRTGGNHVAALDAKAYGTFTFATQWRVQNIIADVRSGRTPIGPASPDIVQAAQRFAGRPDRLARLHHDSMVRLQSILDFHDSVVAEPGFGPSSEDVLDDFMVGTPPRDRDGLGLVRSLFQTAYDVHHIESMTERTQAKQQTQDAGRAL